MIKTVEIDDTLDERTASAIDDLKERIESALKDNDGEASEDDFADEISEIADSAVPVYTNEIDGLWFLHKSVLTQAYEDAGIDDNPLANNGMTAIYFYIEQKVQEWLNDSFKEFCQEWRDKHKKVEAV